MSLILKSINLESYWYQNTIKDINSMSAEHAGTKKWRQKHSHDSNHDSSNDAAQVSDVI